MATHELRTDLRVTGENAAKAGIKGVGSAAENAGDDLRKMGRDAGYLKTKLVELKAAQLALVKQLNETGDVSLIKSINKTKREVSQLERFAKQLEDEGKKAGNQMVKAIGAAIDAGGPYVIGALVGVVAAALPFMGAAVAAAVAGTAGLGGIAGGVALAAHDPKVKQAASELAANLGPAFAAAGEPMVGPIVESLAIVRAEGAKVANDLRGGFATVAPELVPLTKGLTGLVHEMMPGLLKAFESSRPVLRAIANELPKIGGAIGKFFEVTTKDSNAAVLGFIGISRAIQDTLGFAGKLVSTLATIYKGSVIVGAKVTGVMEDVAGWIPGLGTLVAKYAASQNDAFEGMLTSMDAANVSSGSLGSTTQQLTFVTYGLGIAAAGTAEEIEAQRRAVQGLIDVELTTIGAHVAMERALDSFTEAVDRNGKSLNIHEENGRRNIETVLAGIRAVVEGAQREYDLAIAHGATADEAERAAKVYRDSYGPALRAAAEKAYGNTAALQGLLMELDKLDGKRVTYTLVQQGGVTVGAKVKGGTILSGVDGARAGGGDVEPHKLYRVNESGVELLATGSQGGHIYNQSQQASMMSGSSGGSTAPASVVWEVHSGGSRIEDLITEIIRETVRVVGGGDVQKTYGRTNR